MGEGQAIQGTIGGILVIVGILLAISGSGLLGRRINWRVGLGLALSGMGLFMLITSFPQYAIGFSVLATLALAFAAFLTIKEADAREQRHRNNELLKEKRDKEEKLLNEITKWSADVLKHCSSLAHGFNNEMERSEARDKYLTLKFACENLIISVENETFGSDLLNQLQCANNCFDGVNFNSLQDNKNKRTNLELFCRNIREVAFKLLKNR